MSVTTEAIVLENIELGTFEVRLHWKRIGERRCYEVVAREPNPAGESSETTHPHVRGEQLCEGDGRASDRSFPPIRTADGLLPDREPNSGHVQRGQRLRPSLGLERQPLRRLRRRGL